MYVKVMITYVLRKSAETWREGEGREKKKKNATFPQIEPIFCLCVCVRSSCDISDSGDGWYFGKSVSIYRYMYCTYLRYVVKAHRFRFRYVLNGSEFELSRGPGYLNLPYLLWLPYLVRYLS